MRTVQMTLDEELLASVDKAAKKLKTTRSAFTRKALRERWIALRSGVGREAQARVRAASGVQGANSMSGRKNRSWGDL